LSARAFRPGATRPSPWAIPGRPGVPSGGRMGPGDGSRRGWEAGGGAAASWPSNGISSGISSGISNGTRGRRGWGEAGRAGGDRARPGFPERLRRKEPRRLPDPGSGIKTPAMDPAGTRGPEGGAAASWPSNGISSGISNGTRGREGWGGGAGRREIGRVRLSSLTSGSGERAQNPGTGSLCSQRHGRR